MFYINNLQLEKRIIIFVSSLANDTGMPTCRQADNRKKFYLILKIKIMKKYLVVYISLIFALPTFSQTNILDNQIRDDYVLNYKCNASGNMVGLSSELLNYYSYAIKNNQPYIIRIRCIWASQWVSLYQSCISGYWYCWEITIDQNSREYLDINDKDSLITFGIDNSLNPTYNNNFINGSNFDFPQDTYIKSSIVNAAIGLNKEIYVKKGSYHFDNIDGILTITAPYTIVD